MTMDRTTADRVANGLGWFSIGLGAAELLMPDQMARIIGIRENDKRRKILRTYGLREMAAGVGILAQRDSGRAPYVWSRVAGDLMDLSSLGASFGSRGSNKGRLTFATAAVLGVTALDVMCSAQLSNGSAESRRMRLRKTIIIDRQPGELYSFWRDENNWGRFMNFVESVRATGNNRQSWRLKVPGFREMTWDTRITNDVPDTMIAWRTEDNSDIEMSGHVRFEPAAGDRGTMVALSVEFMPPGGAMGAAIAKMMTKLPRQALEMCLRNFKQIIETGEVVRSDASIFTGMHAAQPPEVVPEFEYAQ
jgi:uncharacterized membrane protein